MKKNALLTHTPYGAKYTSVFTVRELLNPNGDKFESMFCNHFAQRAVNFDRVNTMSNDYLKILTSDNITESIPFQSSFVCNLELKKFNLEEDDSLFDGKVLDIPSLLEIISIRDGGHRYATFRQVYLFLLNKIDTCNTKSIINKYKGAMESLLNIQITTDIYVNLDDKASRRCLLDIAQARPITEGRKYLFLNLDVDNALNEFYDNDFTKAPYKIQRDNDRYSQKAPYGIPMLYLKPICKELYEIFELHNLSEIESAKHLQDYIRGIFNGIDVNKKITKDYFITIKKDIRSTYKPIKEDALNKFGKTTLGGLTKKQKDEFNNYLETKYNIDELMLQFKKAV